MDVVCERCQTEYEFDDALVSERGTTVKCTNCGHQFKIYRPPVGMGAPAAAWILRRPDGSTVQFESLAVLQKWIGDGRVTRSDQLSRNGTDWKTLGSIAELESFFAMADTRRPVPSPTGPTRSFGDSPAPTANSTAGWGKVDLAPLPPTPRAPASAGMPGTHGANPAIPQQRSASPTLATRPTVSAIPSPSPSGSKGDGFDLGEATNIVDQWGDNSRPPQRPAVSAPAVPRGRTSNDAVNDELPTIQQSQDDLNALIGRRGAKSNSKTTWLVAAGVIVIGSGVGAAIWRLGLLNKPSAQQQQQASVPNPPDRTSIAIDRAETGARVATRAGYDEARETLSALLANEPDEPRVRAARAAVLALAGEQQRQIAEDLEARAATNTSDAVTLRAEASLVRRDVSGLLDRARQDLAAADSAVGRVPANDRGRFERALGEAARVLGDMNAAQRHLTAARSAGAAPEAELLGALIERDAGHDDAAIAQLRTLSARDEVSARAHLALARVLARRGDATAAAEVDAVLRAQGSNDEAQSLAQAIRTQTPPFRAAGSRVATADAGVAANPAPVVANTGTATEPTPTPTATGGGGGGGGGGEAPRGRSYDALVEEGDRFAERGQNDRARRSYEAALALRADGSEAITGLGFIEEDAGHHSVAIAHFRQALRLNPRYSEAMIGLGEANNHAGNYAEALRAFRDYLSINPSGSHAREAQTSIDALQRRLGSGSSPTGTGGTGEPGSGSTGTTPTPAPTPAPAPAAPSGESTGNAAPSEPAPSGGSGS